MAETIERDADLRPWSLAALAEEAEFDRHVEAAATTIADAFALKVHVNVAERRRAFADWIARVRAVDRRPPDYRTFVAVCASLVAALAARRAVGFTAMTGDPSAPALAVILKYGNEVTALAVGAGVYSAAVAHLVDPVPREPLPAMVIENAAASLRRHPDDAALRFRELLGLPTPWV